MLAWAKSGTPSPKKAQSVAQNGRVLCSNCEALSSTPTPLKILKSYISIKGELCFSSLLAF
jgi:hypothetical protein